MLTLHQQPTHDAASTQELRAAVVNARAQVRDVLDARERTRAAIDSWRGPHRDRYEADTTALLGSGRAVVATIDALLLALDQELVVVRSGVEVGP